MDAYEDLFPFFVSLLSKRRSIGDGQSFLSLISPGQPPRVNFSLGKTITGFDQAEALVHGLPLKVRESHPQQHEMVGVTSMVCRPGFIEVAQIHDASASQKKRDGFFHRASL